MKVELASTQTSDGLRLDGALARPERSRRFPLDLVICHHGVAGNFYNPHVFHEIGAALLRAGCSVLRVNNRGHDLMHAPAGRDSMSWGETLALRSQRGPLGAACEIVDDCHLDWKAWIDFATEAGYSRIALWGHSLGAVKTLYFLAREQFPRVKCAIASSPPQFNHAAALASAAGAQFKASIERAQALVDQGEPRGLITATVPIVGVFSAATYLDKYGPGDRYDIFKLLPQASVPLLVTLGGEERGDGFRELAKEGPSLAARWPHVSFELIAGADHGYSGKTEELWRAARRWLDFIQASIPG